MSDDVDFEIFTNANQLADPPPMRVEEVVLPEVKLKNGKPAKFFQYELTALEYDEFQDTGRIYKDGQLSGATVRNEDLRFLAFTTRDHKGHRIWHNVEDCKKQLGRYGKSVTSKLMIAANKANFGDDASAEGNSDESSGGSERTKSSSSGSN